MFFYTLGNETVHRATIYLTDQITHTLLIQSEGKRREIKVWQPLPVRHLMHKLDFLPETLQSPSVL